MIEKGDESKIPGDLQRVIFSTVSESILFKIIFFKQVAGCETWRTCRMGSGGENPRQT